jgi:hypothetical protein
LRVNNLSPTNNADEFDKLLFYRGAGNFVAPLTVLTSAEGLVTVTNSGNDVLSGLFLLQVNARGDGSLTRLEALKPGVRHDLGKLGLSKTTWHSKNDLLREISRQMETALVGAGLFQREAAAMVKTWSDLWFAEEGTRVLYILPGSWTDEILPITVSPAPQELVRVMVGRAEIIPPKLVREIAVELDQAEMNPSSATRIAPANPDRVKKLGRFGNAALQLATQLRAQERNKPVAAATQP